MMVNVCCVRGCPHGKKPKKGLSFHTFPRALETQLKWINAIKRYDLTINYDLKVCSDHFLESDFFQAGSVKKLRKNTVPTVFPWTIMPGFASSQEKTEVKRTSLELHENSETDIDQEKLKGSVMEKTKRDVKMAFVNWNSIAPTTNSQSILLVAVPNQFNYIQPTVPTSLEELNCDVKLEPISTKQFDGVKSLRMEDSIISNQVSLVNNSLEIMKIKNENGNNNQHIKLSEIKVKEDPDLIEVNNQTTENWLEFKIKEEIQMDEGDDSSAIEAKLEQKQVNESIKIENCLSATDTESQSEHPKKLKIFKCEHCPYKTGWKGNLTKHTVSKHTALDKIKWLNCEHCSYKGKTRDYLKWHMHHVHNMSVKWYTCPQCSFKSKLKSVLNRHIISYHTDSEKIRWFACDQCEYKGKFKTNLKQHILSKHTTPTEIKWVQCEYCPFKAKRKRNLKFHHINKHMDDDKVQWFRCDLCPYKVKIKSVLKSHIVANHTEGGKKNKKNKVKTREIPVFIHDKLCWKRVVVDDNSTEEYVFKCVQCPFETSDKERFKRHVLKAHTVTEIEQIDDDVVKRVYRTKDVVVMVDNVPYIKKVIDLT